MIKYFVKKSIIVASIKHTHHKFEIDREGKDSFKHIHAGSNEVIIYSKRKWAMISKFQQREINIEDILNKFDDKTEFVLVEGLKYSTFPKIEVIRSSLEKPTLLKMIKILRQLFAINMMIAIKILIPRFLYLMKPIRLVILFKIIL